VIPFVILAAVFGAARFSPGRARGAGIALVGTIAFFALFTPKANIPALIDRARAQGARPFEDALALVPGDASVSATEGLGGRLSERRTIYSFPMVRDAEYVVVDRLDAFIPALPGEVRGRRPGVMSAALDRLIASGRYQILLDRGAILVLRRKAQP
jgi:hypothetical protein